MKKNRNNFKLLVALIYIAGSLYWIYTLHSRLANLENISTESLPYIERFLDLEIRVTKLEQDNLLLFQHHLELLGEEADEQQ
jgi:hypothetical protein